jgi:hypothetical protein
MKSSIFMVLYSITSEGGNKMAEKSDIATQGELKRCKKTSVDFPVDKHLT